MCYLLALTDEVNAAINCSGVGSFPQNCDQNAIASGSVEDIPILIISVRSLRTSLTDTPYCFAVCLMIFFIMICSFHQAYLNVTDSDIIAYIIVEKAQSLAGNKKISDFSLICRIMSFLLCLLNHRIHDCEDAFLLPLRKFGYVVKHNIPLYL